MEATFRLEDDLALRSLLLSLLRSFLSRGDVAFRPLPLLRRHVTMCCHIQDSGADMLLIFDVI